MTTTILDKAFRGELVEEAGAESQSPPSDVDTLIPYLDRGSN